MPSKIGPSYVKTVSIISQQETDTQGETANKEKPKIEFELKDTGLQSSASTKKNNFSNFMENQNKPAKEEIVEKNINDDNVYLQVK